jgi:predicted enzyme related to lactoylglutathione lyase
MAETQTLRGVATINIYADDVIAAREWYAKLLGIEAYFQLPDAQNPAYVEFRIGDYQHELGIISRQYLPKAASGGPGGAIVNWHVDNLQETLDRVVAMGATIYEPITPRGEGFVTASVIDPFGNILGLMYNKHYLDILADKTKRD